MYFYKYKDIYCTHSNVLFYFFMTTNETIFIMVIFLYFFLFYHDTYGMKYTHFIEEEGELYRVLPLLDI